MGFLSFFGRLLFAIIFVMAAWQKANDFGEDGGAALKSMSPKIEIFRQHVVNNLGLRLPEIEDKYLLATAIALEGIGGLLFLFGINVGAYCLLLFLAGATPIMHDFYNFDLASPDYIQQLIQFLKNLALFGSLLFFLGMKNSAIRRSRKKTAKVKVS